MSRKPPGFRASRVENNFNMVARDYDRAIALARLSGVESFLMQQAREEFWVKSMPRRKGKAMHGTATPFAYDVRGLAAALGVAEGVIYRGIRTILAMHLLEKGADGRLSIRKDYHDWTEPDGETPLFDEAKLAFIRAATEIGGGPSERSDTSPLVTKMSEASDKNVTGTDKIVTVSDKNVTNTDIFVTRPIEERARRRDSETERDTPTPGGPIADGSGERGGDDADRIARDLSRRFLDDNEDYYRREASMLLGGGFTAEEIDLAIARAFSDPTRRFESGVSVFRFIAKSLPRISGEVRSARPMAPPTVAMAHAPAPARPARMSVAERISADNAARAAKTREIFERRKANAGR